MVASSVQNLRGVHEKFLTLQIKKKLATKFLKRYTYASNVNLLLMLKEKSVIIRVIRIHPLGTLNVWGKKT